MALPSLASLTDLQVRLGRTLEGSEADRAQAALDDASTLVREESGQSWVDASNNVTAPAVLVRIVLQAAKREVTNPEGFVSETTGPFSATRDRDKIGAYLTEEEREIAGRYRATVTGLWTQPTTRGEFGDGTIWGEDQNGFELFPLYADNDFRFGCP